jgi:hypothetical protein
MCSKTFPASPPLRPGSPLGPDEFGYKIFLNLHNDKYVLSPFGSIVHIAHALLGALNPFAC